MELGLIYLVTQKDSEYISANQLSYRYYYLQYRGGPYIVPLSAIEIEIYVCYIIGKLTLKFSKSICLQYVQKSHK